jgi:hypothetical protein
MDPYPDPCIINQKYLKKTLTPTVLRLLFDFLSLKNDVNVPSKSNKQKNFAKKEFFVGVLKVKIAGSGSISQSHGSADSDQDPDPHQNVMDPQHCYFVRSFAAQLSEELRIPVVPLGALFPVKVSDTVLVLLLLTAPCPATLQHSRTSI